MEIKRLPRKKKKLLKKEGILTKRKIRIIATPGATPKGILTDLISFCKNKKKSKTTLLFSVN